MRRPGFSRLAFPRGPPRAGPRPGFYPRDEPPDPGSRAGRRRVAGGGAHTGGCGALRGGLCKPRFGGWAAREPRGLLGAGSQVLAVPGAVETMAGVTLGRPHGVLSCSYVDEYYTCFSACLR